MSFRKLPLAERLRATVLAHSQSSPTAAGRSHGNPEVVGIDVLCGRVKRNEVTVLMSPAEMAVVMALAISNTPPSRDELADKLYPDASREAGLNALKVNVHRARRRLRYLDAIYSDAGRYVLGWCVDVDLARIEADVRIARRAGLTPESRDTLARARRRLRAGRPAYMQAWEWFENTERRLLALCDDITMVLATDALAEHRYDEALALANDVLHDNPLDEPAAEIAIRAFVQCGDSRGAANQYQRYAQALERELSETPPESLRRLVEAATRAANAAHPASPEQTAVVR